jgi:hypothetical protein
MAKGRLEAAVDGPAKGPSIAAFNVGDPLQLRQVAVGHPGLRRREGQTARQGV